MSFWDGFYFALGFFAVGVPIMAAVALVICAIERS